MCQAGHDYLKTETEQSSSQPMAVDSYHENLRPNGIVTSKGRSVHIVVVV